MASHAKHHTKAITTQPAKPDPVAASKAKAQEDLLTIIGFGLWLLIIWGILAFYRGVRRRKWKMQGKAFAEGMAEFQRGKSQ